MTDLLHPIMQRWPAKDPSVLQLYSLPTPNGIKVSAMLEEIGLPYEAHKVSFADNDQMTAEFLALNPNNKIPAILDPSGPDGQPIALWESGAILLYLAEKTGQLMPSDPAEHWQTVQWLMFQMGGVGPMSGQLGFFYKLGGKDFEDKRPRDRYKDEVKRLLGVMDGALSKREYLATEEYTIADIATWPWIGALVGFYDAGEMLEFSGYEHVNRWYQQCLARPASKNSLNIPN